MRSSPAVSTGISSPRRGRLPPRPFRRPAPACRRSVRPSGRWRFRGRASRPARRPRCSRSGSRAPRACDRNSSRQSPGATCSIGRWRAAWRPGSSGRTSGLCSAIFRPRAATVAAGAWCRATPSATGCFCTRTVGVSDTDSAGMPTGTLARSTGRRRGFPVSETLGHMWAAPSPTYTFTHWWLFALCRTASQTFWVSSASRNVGCAGCFLA